MAAQVLQLYPQPGGTRPLQGLYLTHRLHELGTPEQPLVYGNFVSSLDGRIALQDDGPIGSFVPEHLTNAHDWLLFQELQAQADCFITHGGYLRALATGVLDNILQVGVQPDSRHLLEWRHANGLRDQPGVIVASASLDFPIPDSLARHGQRFIIATGEAADPTRVKTLRRRGYEVIHAGHGRCVEATPLIRQLGALGFSSIYLEAGPLILETMLRQGLLARLYLTISHQLLGGEGFHTMLSGPRLGSAGRLELYSLYFDPMSRDQAGQFFALFQPEQTPSA